ncbi:MAG: M48 family metalloprotease [Gammaproteobacteria bacterium]|nr:M48 family metalloprotease [Gammaproteobacteria bacterium]
MFKGSLASITMFKSKKILISGLGLLCWSALTFAASDIELPTIGSEASTRLSATEEKHLGEAFMRQVRQELNVFAEPEIDDYIWSLGYKLVSNSDYKAQNFHFFVVNDKRINAFAGPAGYIGVNAGLILAADNESELAAVVAHEIAHVSQHHLDRAFDAADKMSLPTAAAIVTAIILGTQNVNLAEAAIAATLAANIQSQLNFTRTHEIEADHVGMQILAASKFSPHAMPRFFERLQAQDRLYDNQVPDFLRTHPVTVNRIAESRDRARKYEFQPKPDSNIFHLIKAKLRVLTDDNPSDLIKRYEAELKEGSYRHRPAELYGYAMALLDNRQYDKARKILDQLIREDRERISYLILKGRIEMAAGNHKTGLEIFHEGLMLNPSNTSLSIYYADGLIRDQQPQAAIDILQPMINRQPSALLYQLLAKAQGDAKLESAAHQSLAEYYYIFGYTHAAIEHLQLALEDKNLSTRDRQRIENRLDALKGIALLEKQQ